MLRNVVNGVKWKLCRGLWVGRACGLRWAARPATKFSTQCESVVSTFRKILRGGAVFILDGREKTGNRSALEIVEELE
jgi:hypothetical protein